MQNNGDYPLGADYERAAPWNKESNSPMKLEVTVSETLSRNTTLTVCDYTVKEDEDCDKDETGSCRTVTEKHYDFSDCNLVESYNEQRYTISELLQELKDLANEYLLFCGEDTRKAKHLKHLISESENWISNEFEVVLD